MNTYFIFDISENLLIYYIFNVCVTTSYKSGFEISG